MLNSKSATQNQVKVYFTEYAIFRSPVQCLMFYHYTIVSMHVITIYITDVKQIYIPRKLEIFCEHDRREGSLRFKNFRGMYSCFSSVLYVVLYPDIFHSSSPYIYYIKVSKGPPHFIIFSWYVLLHVYDIVMNQLCMFCGILMIW